MLGDVSRAPVELARPIFERALAHLIKQVTESPAEIQPFGHVYFTNLLPPDLYAAMLNLLPDPSRYIRAAERYHRGEVGGYVRTQYPLTRGGIDQLPARTQAVWRGVAAALTAPKLKQALFAKLAPDLAYRYGIPEQRVPDLAGFSRPTLYRETEGFEIPPHPDTRKKVVTMHLYLPADWTQLELGTALYERQQFAWPFGDWRRRFTKVKQFSFQPNSGYAFVVNNTVFKRSWHGRERLPEGVQPRNTLLNTFYELAREGYGDYLSEAPAARRMAAA